MAGEYVRARLRKTKDADIRAWLDKKIAEGLEEGDIVRAALRDYMKRQGDKVETEKSVGQVRQRPIKPKISIPKLEKPKLKIKEVEGENEEADSIDELLGRF